MAGKRILQQKRYFEFLWTLHKAQREREHSSRPRSTHTYTHVCINQQQSLDDLHRSGRRLFRWRQKMMKIVIKHHCHHQHDYGKIYCWKMCMVTGFRWPATCWTLVCVVNSSTKTARSIIRVRWPASVVPSSMRLFHVIVSGSCAGSMTWRHGFIWSCSLRRGACPGETLRFLILYLLSVKAQNLGCMIGLERKIFCVEFRRRRKEEARVSDRYWYEDAVWRLSTGIYWVRVLLLFAVVALLIWRFSILKVIDSGQFFDEPKYRDIYALLRHALRNTGAQVRCRFSLTLKMVEV